MAEKKTQGQKRPRTKLRLSTAEWAIVACTAIILLGSFLPWTLVPYPMNLWNSTSLFMLGVGVLMPIAYAVMMLTPKLSAWVGLNRGSIQSSVRGLREAIQARATKMKIGSLSARQFGQVAAWLSASYFGIHLLTTLSPILLVGLVGAIGLVLITVLDQQIFGRELHPDTISQITDADIELIPQPPAEQRQPASEPEPDAEAEAEAIDRIQQAEDETRTKGVVQKSPRPTKPTTSGGVPIIAAEEAIAASRKKSAQAHATEAISTEPTPADKTSGESLQTDTKAVRHEPTRTEDISSLEATSTLNPVISAQRSASFDEPRYRPEDAFWFAVQYARAVVSESSGAELFTVQPGNWILALAETPEGFVVRSDNGKVGLMRDVQGIERA